MVTRACRQCGTPFQLGKREANRRYCSQTCAQRGARLREQARKRDRTVYAGAGPHFLGSVAHGRTKARALWELAESNPTPKRYARERARILEDHR